MTAADHPESTTPTTPEDVMPNAEHFVYRLFPPRSTFASDMSDGETAVMGEHAAYWTKHFEDGRVVVFGAVLEPAGVWGLAVVEADGIDEVHAIAEHDPAVRTGTCSFEIGAMLPGAIVRSGPVEA